MNLKVLLIFLLIPAGVFSQEEITLEVCRSKAVENYPLIQKTEVLTSIEEAEKDKLGKNFLPEVNLNAQVHYQSDVTKVPVQSSNLFGIEPLEKDWYKATLDVSQLIYDGGATSKQKLLSEADHNIANQNLEVEFYKLKQRVDQVYFSILVLLRKQEVLNLHLETLEARLKEVKAGVENGVVLQSSADQLKVEILEINQNLEELEISIATALDILNYYTGLAVQSASSLQLPEPVMEISNSFDSRPELMLFQLQNSKLQTSATLLNSRNRPKLAAFGQAGYGRPGLDMLENKFTDFYMIGARLSWKLWDWKKTGKDKEVLGLQQKLINAERETFSYNVNLALKEKLSNIQKLEKQIARDAEIIELRESIVEAKKSELNNGIINASEYIAELNAGSGARLNLEIHKIEKAKAWVEYQTIKGN